MALSARLSLFFTFGGMVLMSVGLNTDFSWFSNSLVVIGVIFLITGMRKVEL